MTGENTVKIETVNCPECDGKLAVISGGGAALLLGYTYLYKHCKNEDCDNYLVRLRIKRFNNGNEELVSIQSPGDDIGDIDQARRSLYQQAIFDFRWFRAITEDTLEFAAKIAEAK